MQRQKKEDIIFHIWEWIHQENKDEEKERKMYGEELLTHRQVDHYKGLKRGVNDGETLDCLIAPQ